MELKKGNIEELLDRNKIKDMKKKNKIFEKGLNKTRDFNGKVELTKLKNGQIPLHVRQLYYYFSWYQGQFVSTFGITSIIITSTRNKKRGTKKGKILPGKESFWRTENEKSQAKDWIRIWRKNEKRTKRQNDKNPKITNFRGEHLHWMWFMGQYGVELVNWYLTPTETKNFFWKNILTRKTICHLT